MEDPWANAWGEPAKPSTALQTTWAHSSNPSLGGLDAEVDIAVPSWATGAGVQWSEPSEDQATLWHPNPPPAKEWVTSLYEDLPVGKPLSNSIPQAEAITVSPVSSPASPKLRQEYPPTDDYCQPDDRSSTPVSAPASAPRSPDAFGTFETGLDAVEDDVDPWAHSVISPDAHKPDGQKEDVWVSSWGAPGSTTELQPVDKPIDEWEAAKQQKARQDQHVPPHVIASILDEFHALSRDLWPSAASSSGEQTIGTSDRRSGMDDVEGLAAIVDRLIPQDLTLPQYVQFSKTFTSKHMGDSLRLTRHVPITRLSPFTLYLSSKGSTAWETSVKSRVEVVNDDLLPPGWRVVEKEKEETKSTIDTKKKGSGGLLSFFGRRAPATPLETNTQRSESPSRPTSASASPSVSSTAASSPATAVTSPTTEGAKSLAACSSTPAAIESPPSTLAISDTTNASTPPGHPSQPTSHAFEPTQLPSAVSRFLTRFSRSKSIGASSRNSLALSTDDLEFLSDIVPSANDEADEASQLEELSTMISSSPLPTKLPPPLAPPPRPHTPRVSSNPLLIASERLPQPSNAHDDLFSLFDSPSSSEKPNAPQVQPVPVPSSFPLSSTQPPVAPNVVVPVPPPLPTSFNIETQHPGLSSFSRGARRPTSPFDLAMQSASRSQSPLSTKRTPVAIMSTGSTSSTNGSSFHIPVPPPILPPPPNQKSSTQLPSRLPSENIVPDDFADFDSPPPPPYPPPQPLHSDTSISSVYSDNSLFADSPSMSAKTNNDIFDDFDDFVSSPIRDPSPPRPPAKPTSFGHRPIPQSTQVLPQPPIKHPSQPPRKVSRAADHQRTMSLVHAAAARSGTWPAAPPPLTEALPPPGAAQPGPNVGGSVMQAKQGNGSGLGASVSTPSILPFSIPPPPGFSVRTSMSPLSPPQLRAVSPSAPLTEIRPSQPLLQMVTPSPAPAASGGLSAQDLSFFEGL